MSYRLHRDESLSIGVRRIAHELVGESVALLDDPGDAVDEAVHEVRKNCKKLRGLLRLVRPALGEVYRPANVTFRDAARQISSIRDAHALLETYDDLVSALHASGTDVRSIDDRDIGGAFLEVRGGLAARAAAASEMVTAGDERIAAARDLIVEGGDRVDAWPLSNDVAALEGGLAKTYRRGRRRLRDCLFHPTDERLHQWRKRAKYTWYHLRLLGDAAPSVLQPLIGRFHDLSDVLGDDHDLAVLVVLLRDQPDEFGGDEAVETAVPVVETVRKDLQQRALRLGPRLYAEHAGAFSTRVVAYWSAWREHGDEWAAGEIADLAPADDDLEERSVRQLYAIARELNVPGRSGMDRDELISSIRAAGWVEPAAT